MKIRDILVPFVLALTAVWIMQYFFPRFQPGADAGSRVAVAQEPSEIKPLNKEVELGGVGSGSARLTEVVTTNGRLTFSTAAASLWELDYKRKVDGKVLDLSTLTPLTDAEIGKNFFLVAVNENAPYSYTLENVTEDDRVATLTYHAHSNDATIEKVYTVYKDSYKVDLDLTIKPRHAVQPRIFFAGPVLGGLSKSEQMAGVMEEKGSVVKYLQSRYLRELNDNFWQQPTLFGAEDRYFINAMVSDPNNFTQRAYYKVDGNKLYPILEGPTIEKEKSWKLSFYIGPKEQAAMAAVDPRLEAVLDFGWLAPLSKLMLWFMLWLNGFVHNFGLVIILLTLFIRLLMLPLSFGRAKQAENVKEMNRKLQYAKQKYKDNPEELKREQEEIYKKYGLGGLGGGCLPLLLQFPIFIAINRLLSSSIDLYKAPFLWIPDLSATDPYYILPILVAGSMFLMSKFQASDAQQKVSGVVMAVVLGAVSMGFSAGLALYLAVSTFIGAIEILIQNKLKS